MQATPHLAEAAVTSPSFGDIPLDCIRVSKTNPRKIFDENHLQDLAASIKKQGVAQPILVRPIETIGDVTFFELVAGERRFRASRLAGNTTVPAVVRTLTDREAFELQVLENLQRVDLHPLEEAEGFEALMKQFSVTADELAEKVGKSKAYIYASLKLCALEPKARESFYAGTLTKSTALLVARIPVKKLQEQCVAEITKGYGGPMSFRTAAEHIERKYMLHLKKADFKPSDELLLPEAGSCSGCPKRTGNQPEIFTDVNADVCTDPGCFKAKTDAHIVHVKKLAIENGQTVLSGAEAKKVMPSSYGDLKGGYVQLDKTVWSDPKQRTYRQILGKQAPAPTLLENPHGSNEIVHIVKLADIAPILKEKGQQLPNEKADATRDREKEQEAKAKLEREYRKRLFHATHHASHMMNLVDQDLRLVALQMFENLPGNTTSVKVVMELHGWADDILTWPRHDKIKAAVDTLTPAQLNQFIRDCSLCRELEINVYTPTSKDKPENLLAFAERAKVNAKQIRTEVEGQAKAKADAKKKAAGKKEAKKSPTAPAPTPTPTAVKSTKKTPAAKKSTATTKASKANADKPAEAVAATDPPEAAYKNTAWPFPTSSDGKREAPTDPKSAIIQTKEQA
jgi:ParB/RepB/Spo0J family partition protein